jgi:hypothetical protein
MIAASDAVTTGIVGRWSAPAFAEGFGAFAAARCASGGGRLSAER